MGANIVMGIIITAAVSLLMLFVLFVSDWLDGKLDEVV